MSEKFTLANRNHLELLVALLIASGAACPECGHGTRKTSKRWAKCKKCGTRVARKELDECVVPEGERPVETDA